MHLLAKKSKVNMDVSKGDLELSKHNLKQTKQKIKENKDSFSSYANYFGYSLKISLHNIATPIVNAGKGFLRKVLIGR